MFDREREPGVGASAGRQPIKLIATLAALAIAVGLISSGAFAQRGAGTRGCNNGQGGGGYGSAAGYGTRPPGPTGGYGSVGVRGCPAPVVGRTVNVAPRSGTVLVREPRTRRFVRLRAGDQIPVGSVLDTRRGVVILDSAAGTRGSRAGAAGSFIGVQTGDFSRGIFRVLQPRTSQPTTTLALTQRLTCGRASGADATAARRSRRLFGSSRGRFRTRGRHATATVRGTRWLTQDTCAGTLVRVSEGVVSVRDLVRRRTVEVRAGDRYFARAPRR